MCLLLNSTFVTMIINPLLIIAFILVSTDVNRCFSESYSSRSWFNAQKHCRNLGSRLEAPPLQTNGTFWTPLHKRFSNWIRILGCYNESDIGMSITSKTETMKTPSAGRCQEICKAYGNSIFAVQNDTCKCLNSSVGSASLEPSECNYTCNNHVDPATFYSCGGRSTYNLFLSDDSRSIKTPNRCMSIQCGKESREYVEYDCGQSYNTICQGDENFRDNFGSWRKAMEYCEQRSKSYLFGDLPIGDKNVICDAINVTLTGPTWIGIATQIYISRDQGKQIQDRDQKLFHNCQRCTYQDSNVTCDFTKCSEHYKFTCKKMTTTNTTKSTTYSPTKQSTTTTYSPTKQSTTTKFTTSSSTKNIATNTTINRNSNAEGSSEDSVLVGILVTVTVLIVAGIVIGIIIFKRKQTKIPNNFRKAGLKNELPEIKQNTNHNESNNSTNNNYFVLEPPKSNYEVPEDNTQESESPYTDGEEGTYDHLRDKESRRKTTDNVYQHAHCLQNNEASDYDFAGRAQNQEIENPYYDHANEHTRNSDYGYNTLDRS